MDFKNKDIQILKQTVEKTIRDQLDKSFINIDHSRDIRIEPLLKTRKVYKVTYSVSCNTELFLTDEDRYESSTFYANSLEDAEKKAISVVPVQYNEKIKKVEFYKEEEYSDDMRINFTYSPKISLDFIPVTIKIA
jgi:hypothetical protein